MTEFRLRLIAGLCGFFGLAATGLAQEEGPRRQLHVPDLRPGHFDWGGAYGGILFSVKSFKAGVRGLGAEPDSVDGSGRVAGLLAGYNEVQGNWLLGAEADIGYGQLRGVRRNRRFKADLTGTLRLRFGRHFDNNLLYATGGMLFAGINQSSGAMIRGDTSTQIAAVAGAGVEHAFTRSLSARLEYLYAHGLRDSGIGFQHMHMIRAGAAFHFPQ